MKPRTVNDLWRACVAERKKGNGNKVILASTDDEGNEYRPIYYDLSPIDDFDENDLMLGDLKKEDCIILG